MDWLKENWIPVALIVVGGIFVLSFAFLIVVMGIQVILHGVTNCTNC